MAVDAVRVAIKARAHEEKRDTIPSMSRLRSPRGSPRKRKRQKGFLDIFFSNIFRYRYFGYLVLCLLPLVIILQWQWTLSSTLFAKREDPVIPVPAIEDIVFEKSQLDTSNRIQGTSKVTSDVQSRGHSDTKKIVLGDRKDDHNELTKYEYSANPILPLSVYKPKSEAPLPVVFVGTAESMDQDTGYLLDGLERSRYIDVIQTAEYIPLRRKTHVHKRHSAKATLPTMYIIDWASLSRDCHVLHRILANDLYLKKTENCYLVYIDMSASTKTVACPNVETIFARERIRIAKRSIVEERYWNRTKQWVELGRIVANGGSQMSAGPIAHAPLPLRESFVDQLYNVTSFVKRNMADRERKNDVALYWRKGDNTHYSFLRRKVGSDLVALKGMDNHGSTIRPLVRILGDEDAIEHNLIQPEYVQHMISTKIVVVAQHDEWEDHLRLMEALGSGAMVMTDAILAPPKGLKHKSNVVIYNSAKSLKRQLLFYLDPKNEVRRLSIARKGWEFVMGNHRSWHRIESLLFETVLTHMNKPQEKPARQTGRVH